MLVWHIYDFKVFSYDTKESSISGTILEVAPNDALCQPNIKVETWKPSISKKTFHIEENFRYWFMLDSKTTLVASPISKFFSEIGYYIEEQYQILMILLYQNYDVVCNIG